MTPYGSGDLRVLADKHQSEAAEAAVAGREAAEAVEGWLAEPNVRWFVPGPGHHGLALKFLRAVGTAGKEREQSARAVAGMLRAKAELVVRDGKRYRRELEDPAGWVAACHAARRRVHGFRRPAQSARLVRDDEHLVFPDVVRRRRPRRQELLDRAESYLKARTRIDPVDAADRLERFGRQLGFGQLTLDELRELAREAGRGTLTALLDALNDAGPAANPKTAD